MEIKKKNLESIYMTLFVLVIIFVVFINMTNVFPYNLVVIDNSDPNSMWPTYGQGDIFIIKNTGQEDFNIGDVIVYTKETSGANIIHRIIDIQIIDGKYYYRVKGDNFITNSIPDTPNEHSSLIPYDNVMGRVVLRIPEIGHFSLAIQGNPFIKVVTLLIAAALALFILAWPEEKSKKDDEMVEINIKTIKAELFKKYILPFKVIFNVKNKKSRYLLFFSGFVMVILILTPLFITSMIPTNYSQDTTGVFDASFGKVKQMNESMNNQSNSYLFIQVAVSLYDDGGYFESLNRFEINVYTVKGDISSLVSHTVWKTLRDIKGTVVIGSSIVIHDEDKPISGTILYVEIVYDIDHLFTIDTAMYSASFTLNY